jgi:hypothetical protein
VRRSILFSVLSAADQSIRFIPIAGRKTVRVSAIMRTGIGPADLSIRGISATVQTGVFPPPQTPDLLEFPLSSLTVPAFGMAPSVTVRLTDPTCHYLHLVVDAAAAGTMEISVEARD